MFESKINLIRESIQSVKQQQVLKSPKNSEIRLVTASEDQLEL